MRPHPPKSTLVFLALLAVLAAAGVLRGGAQAPALPQSVAAALDELAQAEFVKDGTGGATVAAVKGGVVVWANAYGLADIGAKRPATTDTVYRIGSITKPFTALMLLQLVERGRVRLSDPVGRYFPEIARVAGRPPGSPPITLLQLATMTAGLAREPEDLPTFLVGPVERWEEVVLKALERTKYAHEPGTRYLYSNIGYAILGLALGRAAGRPYVEYVREQIIQPLGMTHTDFLPTPQIRPLLANGYDIRQGKPDGDQAAREHDGRGYKVPNGALYTTAADLAKYVALMLGEGPESVLPRAAIADNLTRVASATGGLTSGYGIGFQVQRRGELVTYGHGGSVAGYRAQILYHPQSKSGVIVLRNVGGGSFNPSALAQRMLATLVH
ncbi:MAG TPA: serine hydrolase domain-containing protein [Vicinamibacterales bacterium]|nr:serine hydrolase domain-containing protein [Vicinamibacterales bacterium]